MGNAISRHKSLRDLIKPNKYLSWKNLSLDGFTTVDTNRAKPNNGLKLPETVMAGDIRIDKKLFLFLLRAGLNALFRAGQPILQQFLFDSAKRAGRKIIDKFAAQTCELND